jgi:hypothetical protein
MAKYPNGKRMSNIIQTAPRAATAITFAYMDSGAAETNFLLSPTVHIVPGDNFFLHSFESLESYRHYFLNVLSYSCTYAYKSTQYFSTYNIAECFF